METVLSSYSISKYSGLTYTSSLVELPSNMSANWDLVALSSRTWVTPDIVSCASAVLGSLVEYRKIHYTPVAHSLKILSSWCLLGTLFYRDINFDWNHCRSRVRSICVLDTCAEFQVDNKKQKTWRWYKKGRNDEIIRERGGKWIFCEG